LQKRNKVTKKTIKVERVLDFDRFLIDFTGEEEEKLEPPRITPRVAISTSYAEDGKYNKQKKIAKKAEVY